MIVYQCRPKDTLSTQLLSKKQSCPAMQNTHSIRHLNRGIHLRGMPSKIAISRPLSNTLPTTAKWSTILSETSSQMTPMAPTSNPRRTTKSRLRLSRMSMRWVSYAPVMMSSQPLPSNVPYQIQLPFGCAPPQSQSALTNQRGRATGRSSWSWWVWSSSTTWPAGIDSASQKKLWRRPPRE